VKIGRELASDLYQELFLILCEKTDEWVEEKYISGYWEGFVSRIILNQFYGKRTSFEKNFLRPIALEDTNEVQIEDMSEPYDESHFICIDLVVARLDWYEQRIWELWSKGDHRIKPRSARAISRLTGISRQEILAVLKKIKEQINDEYAFRNTRSELLSNHFRIRDRLEGED
jgi:hypothetical protein